MKKLTQKVNIQLVIYMDGTMYLILEPMIITEQQRTWNRYPIQPISMKSWLSVMYCQPHMSITGLVRLVIQPHIHGLKITAMMLQVPVQIIIPKELSNVWLIHIKSQMVSLYIIVLANLLTLVTLNMVQHIIQTVAKSMRRILTILRHLMMKNYQLKDLK